MWAICDQITVAAAGFATSVVVARAIGAAGLGRYAVSQSGAAMALTLVEATVLTPYLVFYRSAGPAAAGRTSLRVFMAVIGPGLLLAVGVTALGRVEGIGQLVATAWLFALTAVYQLAARSLVAAEAWGTLWVVDACGTVTQLLVLGLLWWLGLLTVPAALLALGGVRLLVAALIWRVRPPVPGEARPAGETLRARDYLFLGGWGTVSSALGYLQRDFPVLALARWTAPEVVSLFAAARQLLTPVQVALSGLQLWLVSGAAKHAVQSPRALAAHINRFRRVVGLVGVAGLLVLAVAPGWVLGGVYGARFAQGATTVRFLAPAVLLAALRGAAGTEMTVVLQLVWPTVANAVSLASLAALIFLFASHLTSQTMAGCVLVAEVVFFIGVELCLHWSRSRRTGSGAPA